MSTAVIEQQQDQTEVIQALQTRIEALEEDRKRVSNHLNIGVISGSLDTVIAAFIIALGATAYDLEVDMFFTFWGIAALRDPHKRVRKNFMERMFGWMLPRGSRALALGKLQMLGIGPRMIRGVMRRHGVKSLERMIQEAGELGVRIHVCDMSMGVMGIKEGELIDYPGLDHVGVGTFVQLATEAQTTFFL